MKNKIEQILGEGLVIGKRIKFDLSIPEDISELNHIFKRNGFELFIVGGAIRDALLGKSPKDYDLATNALPDKVEEMMNTNNIRTIATGKAFGVINVFTNQGEYEIATFRHDIGSDGRRPDSVKFTNIEGDVKRRDLTINALFYDIEKGEIVDLVGGINDIKNGVVRTVGLAEDRFGEDRLRILRAIRFAARFGSELETKTDIALQKNANLEGISSERIRDEFIKGIKSAKSTSAFLMLNDKYELFDWIFPDLKIVKSMFNRGDDYMFNDYLVVLARLLKNNTVETIREKLNILSYSTTEIKGIIFLVTLLKLDSDNAYSLKKSHLKSGISNNQIRDFGSSEGIPSQLLDAFEEFTLTVSGSEIMFDFNLKPGKNVGELMQKIETENFNKILKPYLVNSK